MRGLPVSFSNIYAIFLTTMVILQIPMTANTHDISAPDAAGRMARATDILMNKLTFQPQMTGCPNFVSEKESGLYGVQARMNDQQGRNGKVWDTVVSDYWEGLT
jgi:hypothetical protein